MQESQRKLTRAETAEMLNVSPRTVDRLADLGKLPRIVVTPRCIRFDEADIKKFLNGAREPMRQTAV